jgi:phage terminase large subunit-like protein
VLHSRLYDFTRELIGMPAAEVREFMQHAPQPDLARYIHALQTDWRSWARPKQLFPWEDRSFRFFVACAGRGFGKTLMGAQTVREAAESGLHQWISVCAPTVSTLYRDQLTGPSGLLTISPRWFWPEHHASKNQLVYPRHPVTGVRTRVVLLSADKPDRIRSSQCSFLWADEPQSWSKPQESFQMLDLSLRLGQHPRGIITMTPKDNALSRDLLLGTLDEETGKRTPRSDVRYVRGSTYENTSLSEEARESYRKSYEGSRLGRQELYGELLEAPDGALWTKDVINRHRQDAITVATKRTVVGVDPSRSEVGLRDLCGIVVGALGADGHVYVYEDASTRGGPLQWAQKAVTVAQKYRADAIVYEANSISSDITKVIRVASEQSGTHWRSVVAKGTKQMRAEPVAALYEAGRVHHVGTFEFLEDEMVGWDPSMKDSPDRMDALVHMVTDLALGAQRHALAVR